MCEVAVRLAVAGGVCGSVFFVLSFSHETLDKIFDLIESLSEGCPAYSVMAPT